MERAGGIVAKRRLIWIILAVIILPLGVPAAIAERYTSPTQDGQYLANPVKAYGFIFTLARVGGSATLGNSGKALAMAKAVFKDERVRPTKVELLYLPHSTPYSYISRAGQVLTIASPPKLVWEIWGDSPSDVVGFLDYVSGARLGMDSLP